MDKLKNADMILIGIGEEFENIDDGVYVYNKLAEELEGKNYFIVTLCMDDQIFSSNLDSTRIVAPMGGKRFKQCPNACTHDLYSLDENVCMHCGKELVYNSMLAPVYVEEGYMPQWQKYRMWLTGTLNKKLLLLELGVSMKMPGIIRFAFERTTALNIKSELIRVNELLPQVDINISDRAEAVHQSAVEWVKSLC